MEIVHFLDVGWASVEEHGVMVIVSHAKQGRHAARRAGPQLPGAKYVGYRRMRRSRHAAHPIDPMQNGASPRCQRHRTLREAQQCACQ
jgi:hypothetical protein